MSGWRKDEVWRMSPVAADKKGICLTLKFCTNLPWEAQGTGYRSGLFAEWPLNVCICVSTIKSTCYNVVLCWSSVNANCMTVQKSELIMSIPRKVMLTSSTARTSVLGEIDHIKCMLPWEFIMYTWNASPVHVVQWVRHSDAACSRAWRARLPLLGGSILASVQ